MPDYETLRIVWWLLLGALLIGFALTDGFDLGVAMIFRFIGRGDEERRVLLECIEPVWEGNQVWFVLGGGAVFAAWPLLYAASFSTLYLAMFVLLLSFIVRPVGFNFRDKLPDASWRALWDWVLTVAGAVAGLLFGVAFGNLFHGVPYHFDELMRPVCTGSFLGLLNPFALLAGVVSLSMLMLHGAAYAALKAGDPMRARARVVGGIAALVLVVALLLAGAWLVYGPEGQRIVSAIVRDGPSDPLSKQVMLVPGAWLDNYRGHPALWLMPVSAVLLGLLAAWLLRAGRAGLAFVCSSLTQAAIILMAGSALFPFLMPSSTHPSEGLTVWDASSSATTLSIMLAAVAVFLPIVLLYTGWVFRVLRGQVTLAAIRDQSGPY